ncbi:PEPxxWA-CTERM sorting domain-containing protein [Microvirga sp. SRT01]|jgi:hypothetical protein|uniref:PEPxxWA-CTERM sorting domain-containing protein n=1 Tax=Sphingomonas longa TaxID=2778730 RepID=A0ABS2D9X5_9SPHN|nr:MULTISPECIES: PEPxxWA-CTERM sorting domain-containing protein [Alphaproteobacteria]MBM6577730.1 PEPxxWA-CTERM sorting domain-containing protein [Sphingomonas sp. BT552]MBR7710772.1 PEPxxWA-CTERM sorting domain-containing protein [Microvirga sp. SRT01]
MQTKLFNISGISSFSFVTSGSLYGENTVQIDNIVYDLAAGGGVPEPASWALMIAGIGAAGGALRRRRAVSTTVSFA